MKEDDEKSSQEEIIYAIKKGLLDRKFDQNDVEMKDVQITLEEFVLLKKELENFYTNFGLIHVTERGCQCDLIFTKNAFSLMECWKRWKIVKNLPGSPKIVRFRHLHIVFIELLPSKSNVAIQQRNLIIERAKSKGFTFRLILGPLEIGSKEEKENLINLSKGKKKKLDQVTFVQTEKPS